MVKGPRGKGAMAREEERGREEGWKGVGRGTEWVRGTEAETGAESSQALRQIS